MKSRAPLSEAARRNRPPRRWYGYIGVIAGLGGFGGTIAVFGFIILRASGEKVPTDALVLQTFLSIIGIFVFVLAQSKRSEVETPFLDQNDLDFETSKAIQGAISTLLLSQPPSTDASVQGVRVYQRMSLGEIKGYFDTQASEYVEGWLNHRLGIAGFELGLQLHPRDGRVGRIETDGQRVANLEFATAMGDISAAEGLVAVLEQEAPKGVVDTLRVIVPPESATREFVGQFANALGKLFGENSYRDAVLAGSASLLRGGVATDVSYVSDRFEAILRMPPESRPTVTVIGVEVTRHVIVGGAIQFGEDKNLYQLFPIGLIQKVTDTVVRACTHGPAERS